MWRTAGTYAKHHHQHRNIRRLSVFRKDDADFQTMEVRERVVQSNERSCSSGEIDTLQLRLAVDFVLRRPAPSAFGWIE